MPLFDKLPVHTTSPIKNKGLVASILYSDFIMVILSLSKNIDKKLHKLPTDLCS